jgi:hypothetical protein
LTAAYGQRRARWSCDAIPHRMLTHPQTKDSKMKRHKDAVAIQAGACNPLGIALSIVEACREIRAGNGFNGTDQITSDPAVRLMVHQLAFICKADDAYIGDEYSTLIETCEAAS